MPTSNESTSPFFQICPDIQDDQPAVITLDYKGYCVKQGLTPETAAGLIEWLQTYYLPEQSTPMTFGGNWSVEDIQQSMDENFPAYHPISSHHAIRIAYQIEKKHDASVGINWEVIEDHIGRYLEENQMPQYHIGDNVAIEGKIDVIAGFFDPEDEDQLLLEEYGCTRFDQIQPCI